MKSPASFSRRAGWPQRPSKLAYPGNCGDFGPEKGEDHACGIARSQYREHSLHACMFGIGDADDTRPGIFLRWSRYKEERTDRHDSKLRVDVLDNDTLVLRWLFNVFRADLARVNR